MAAELAFDVPPEQRNAGPEDHIDGRYSLEDIDEKLERIQRGSEIRVPEARIVEVLVRHREQHASPHGLRFSLIWLHVQRADLLRVFLLQRQQDLEGGVLATVVDEHEAHLLDERDEL